MSGPGVGPAAAAAVANGLLAGLNAGTNPSVLQIYGGAQPAAGLPGAGPLICEVELQRPAGVVSGGALQLAIDGAGGVAAVAATPTWARLLDGAGAWFLDLRARLLTTTLGLLAISIRKHRYYGFALSDHFGRAEARLAGLDLVAERRTRVRFFVAQLELRKLVIDAVAPDTQRLDPLAAPFFIFRGSRSWR